MLVNFSQYLSIISSNDFSEIANLTALYMLGTKVRGFYDSKSTDIFGNTMAEIEDSIHAIHLAVIANPDKQAACDNDHTTVKNSISYIKNLTFAMLGTVEVLFHNGDAGSPLGRALCTEVSEGSKEFHAASKLCYSLTDVTAIGKCLQKAVC